MASIKVIITGATGMVGEGVLFECLQNSTVSEVLIINRRHYDLDHPKLKELIVSDFFQLDQFAQKIKGYDACFFCAGVSSVGMKEEKYTYITYDTTIAFARTLLNYNNDMSFCYVSGSHTDSSEKGRMMWARVKGKTENDLMKLPFKKVYNFRPGIIQPTPGLKNTLRLYTYLGWLIPVMRMFGSKSIVKLKELGEAMINAAATGYEKQIIEVRDILALAKR